MVIICGTGLSAFQYRKANWWNVYSWISWTV